MSDPFISGTYQLDSKPASVQRTVNMMPVALELGNERTGWVFKDVPGLTKWGVTTVPVDPVLPIWLWLRGEQRTGKPNTFFWDSSIHHRTVTGHGGAVIDTSSSYMDAGSVALLNDGDYLSTDTLDLTSGEWDIRFAMTLPTANGSYCALYQNSTSMFYGLPGYTFNAFINRTTSGSPAVPSYLVSVTGYTNTSGNQFVCEQSFTPTGPYVFVRAVRHGDLCDLYVDGVLLQSFSNPGSYSPPGHAPLTPSGPLQIGYADPATPMWARAHIDEVYIDTVDLP